MNAKKSPVADPVEHGVSASGKPVPKRAWWRWVPIRRLVERHRARLLGHILSLNERDRYLRFGYPASDERIRHYVRMLDFSRDEVFGIFNRRLELVATSHLAHIPVDEFGPTATSTTSAENVRMAEFAVSVLPQARGRGYGDRLFVHAVRHLRNLGLDRLFIHALSENTAMLRIARKAGATVTREGGESEAWLQLPRYSLGSKLEELIDVQAAELNYGVKRQARLILVGLKRHVWTRWLGA